MEVLWDRGTATVSDVVDNVVSETPLAYSTVLTTLRILETKGYIKHTTDGRAFVYRPVVKREKAQDKAITLLLRRFFEDSPGLLMLNLLETKKLSSEEISRLRKRIAEKKS